MSLLLNEKSDLIKMVINTVRKDLEDHRELWNCLALQAIANVGGKEFVECSEQVERLLYSE